MSRKEKPYETLNAFAELVEYPKMNPAPLARKCSSLLANPVAASVMGSFADYCETHSLESLQEVYTRTFDLQPSCSPYVGYHLFGDSYRRGNFLAKLKERYEETGLQLGKELPDHLTLILRFLSLSNWSEEKEELMKYCLLPALEKMTEPLLKEENPYGRVLRALFLTIGPSRREEQRVKAEVRAS